MTASSSKRPHHLGLQTKVASIIFVAMAITMLATTIGNYYLVQQYHQTTVRSNIDQLENTLINIIKRSGTYLERISSQIETPDISAKGLKEMTLEAPSLFSGIDSSNLTNASGDILLHWSLPGNKSNLPSELVKTLSTEVLQTGRPINRIFCASSCIHSVFIPQIAQRGEEVVINANLSLVDLLKDFKSITGSDLVFFQDHDWQDQRQHHEFILLSSDPDSTRSLVEELVHNKSFNKDGFYLGNLGTGYFAAKRIQLTPPVAIGHIDLLLLTDESQAFAFIKKSFQNDVISSSITLVLASFILIIVLRSPINRIRFLSKNLPKLAQQDFQTIKADIAKARDHVFFRDEIYSLADVMENTTDSLELLNSEVQQHRKELEEKIRELQEARDFNQFLVDGSPLAIIVYRTDGSIRSMNQYARNICGKDLESSPGLNIEQLILSDDAGHSIGKVMAVLSNGDDKRLQTEQPLYSQDGKNHDLNWVHTSLVIQNELCFLSVGLDITERREIERRMRWLSKHDHISGLLNRATFTQEAEDRLKHLNDGKKAFLLICDIDEFASLNDRFGLQTGDTILEQTAQNFTSHLPAGALIARTGSNEFSALLTNEDLEPGSLTSDLTHFTIEEGNDSLDIQLTGVLLNYPEHGSNIDELLANAAEALHVTKEKNRGKIVIISDTLKGRNLRQEKLATRDKILYAFEDNRFVLFYQPIYHLASQTISHCECLIRMLGDDGSFVPPGLFLDVAREFNLMPRLDHHVMEMAMKQQARWKNEGRDIKLSINVTPATFQTDNFRQEMQTLIRETGAQGDHLIFEIVETEALENISFAQTIAEELTSIGAELAFDDFGIGFTSFEYLRELPVDYVKIDQSFIRYLDQREKDQLLVKSMVDMSLALDKKIIAEGVETRAAYNILEEMGVHYIQGYYLARPAPATEVDFNRKII